MNEQTLRQGPGGRELLAGTPAAGAYCRRLAAFAFPQGLPSRRVVDRVRAAVWEHVVRASAPAAPAIAWNPDLESVRLIGQAFGQGGLAPAYAEATRLAVDEAEADSPSDPHRPRVSSVHELDAH